MTDGYRFPCWLRDDLNEYLFNRLGLCFKHLSLVPDYPDVEIISLCGSITLGLPPGVLDAERETALEEFIDWALTSHWYRNILADTDFGSFRKSDLFHRLNTDFVIPTQLAAGRSASSKGKGKFSLDEERFFLSYMEHREDEEGILITQLYGEIPECDGFNLSDLLLGKQPTLSEAVKTIFDGFPDEDLGWSYRLHPGASEMVRKPQSAGELLKYAAYVGFSGGPFYEESETQQKAE